MAGTGSKLTPKVAIAAVSFVIFWGTCLAMTVGVMPGSPAAITNQVAEADENSPEAAAQSAAHACADCGVVSAVEVVENTVKQTRRWNVVVRMNNGSSRMFWFDSDPAFRAGDKVRAVSGKRMV
jgi:outer membrane lipoprotein SlyB